MGRLVNRSPPGNGRSAVINPFRRSAEVAIRQSAERLYTLTVRQARQPAFYGDFGVPDTPDGRFDMIALHVYMVLRRLKQLSESGQAIAQALFDHMFADLDHNLREMGVGDLGVGRHVKAMAAGFYGRVAAYDAGLEGTEGELALALARNLYRGTTPMPAVVDIMAQYVRTETVALGNIPSQDILQGNIHFGPVPTKMAV